MSPRAHAPEHPGELLRRRMRDARISANRLAGDIRVPTNRLTKVVNRQRGISADTAVRLGHWFGTDPWPWLEAQARYDLHVASRRLKRSLANRPTRETSI